MTDRLDIIEAEMERFLNARITRRGAAEDRAIRAYDRRAVIAEQMIGQLVRDGRTVCYVFPTGGKYREGGIPDLVDFLIRNDYV